jgi:flavin reductase (DIM6/NTAB) family NADH-FMN oxidoreductase RutF
MHVTLEPSILYFGTPVALISTCDTEGAENLAPISSIFWLGWRCVVGIAATSKTTENLLRASECVVNLPSEDLCSKVNRLALTTGTTPVPAGKAARGYMYVRDKFECAELTPQASVTVRPPRVKECPVQLEAVLVAQHPLAANDEKVGGRSILFELRVTRVHAATTVIDNSRPNHINPDAWRPLIMSFQQFYGLSRHQLEPSALASISEHLYRTADVDRAAAGLA